MPRQKLVSVRLSVVEYARLSAAAEAARTSLATHLRDLAFAALGPAVSAPQPLGRAPADRLTRKVSSRLTATEAESLAERARECDLAVAAYVRQVLRGTTPSARRPEVHAALVALSRIGNNLNQLTRLAHGGTLFAGDLFRAIAALRVEVYRVREEILAALESRP
jgi:hypothetical protein